MKHIRTPFLTLGIWASEVTVGRNCVDITRDATAVPRYIMDLTYLRKIVLNNVKDESLPPFGLLPSLLELDILGANNVGKVGDEFLGISSNNTTAAFNVVFPRLEKLSFVNMGAWREWEDPVHGGNINLAILPSLCHLRIFDCEKLKSLPHFFNSVPLQTLEVAANEEGDMVRIRNGSRMDEDTACRMIIASAATLSQPEFGEIRLHCVKNDWGIDWAKYCERLRKLCLWTCSVASLAALKLLPSLEFLSLGCMYDSEESEDPPPQLEISDESREFMPSLRRLHIYGCPKLKALPSCLRSVPLKELNIDRCPGLATWWINEAGEDWYNWKSNIPRFNFPDLERVGRRGA